MHSRQTSAAAIPAASSRAARPRRRPARAAFGGLGHLDPVMSPGALADEAGPVEDLAELVAQVAIGEPRTRAAEAGTASRAWAGPPRQAIARWPGPFPDVLRGSWPEGRSGPWSGAAPPSDRRPGRDRSDRLRQRTSRAPPGRRGRGRPARSSSMPGARRSDSGQADALTGSGGSHAPPTAPPPARRCGCPSWTSSPPRASRTATAVPQEPAPITAARRIGGRPPRSSHCSWTLGQIRACHVFGQRRRGIGRRGGRSSRGRGGP